MVYHLQVVFPLTSHVFSVKTHYIGAHFIVISVPHSTENVRGGTLLRGYRCITRKTPDTAPESIFSETRKAHKTKMVPLKELVEVFPQTHRSAVLLRYSTMLLL